jgi:alkylation response protein AidB-like acyl-CoA dehydrogenase
MMRFKLTDEQQMVRKMVHEFADRQLKPNAQKIDMEARFPLESFKEAGALGLVGAPLPSEFGGGGMGAVEWAVIMEEMARGCGSTTLTLAGHTSLCCGHINIAGTHAQKLKWLPRLASGEWIGGWALTEAGSGSDAAGLKTRAVREGDHWVLNGSKMFCTNGSKAQAVVMLASTSPDKGSHGITAFVVETSTEGFHATKDEHKMGLRGSATSELVFDQVKVPDANRLGDVDRGFADTLKVLDNGRIGIGAMAVGLSQAALEDSIAYAKQRTTFGKKLAEHQAIQFMIADMTMEVEAARLLVFNAAQLKDKGRPFRKEASMAKLYASEMSSRVTNKAVQIFGGYGYVTEYNVERYLRDAKLTEIGEGTSEVQRIVIARSLGLES